ncbi:MAG: hypothetical protein WB777_13355 [Mycobacterium sp.]
MPQLRVDTAALQAIATNWGAAAGHLTGMVAPTTGLDVSSQPSAAAVNAAHADVAVFTADLATRVTIRAQHVTDANNQYIDDDLRSMSELAAVTISPTVV